MKERVYGEKVSIDTENTVSFYDQRAKTIKNRKQEYTTVLLGDQDPDFSVKAQSRQGDSGYRLWNRKMGRGSCGSM